MHWFAVRKCRCRRRFRPESREVKRCAICLHHVRLGRAVYAIYKQNRHQEPTPAQWAALYWERLQQIDKLWSDGLINDQEREETRRRILNDL